MYLTEIAPLIIRGAMGVLCPLGITVGVLISQVLGLKEVLGNLICFLGMFIINKWILLLGHFFIVIFKVSITMIYLTVSEEGT